jgi:hypothetical protein
VIYPIKSDRGLGPTELLRGSRTHSVDWSARKFELTSGLMGDGSAVDQHDCLLPGEGHGDLSPWVTLELLALGKSPRGHVVFHHGALFEVVPDDVHMIWEGHLEKLLEVIGRLPRLALEIALGGSDMFLIGVVLILAIVIIITACSNCDLLVMLLLPLLTAIGASLSAFADSLGWCPLATVRVSPLPWTKTAPATSSPKA